jgi:sec-independent protein translocase protein TatC
MQRPIIQALRNHGLGGGLVYLNPTEPLNLYLEVGLVAGLFVASPFVFYQLWSFIAPGLYRNEKRYLLPFVLSTVALFVAGGVFGYRIVYPAVLEFLIGYGQRFQPMITIGEYTKLFLTIIIGLGLIFEMPILVFFLALMRVITTRRMWRNLRYSILFVFIIATMVTPTTDILNMCLFAAPMIVLYGISIGLAWLVNRSQRPKNQIDKRGIHFNVASVMNLKAGSLVTLGNEQLEWPEDDLKQLTSSTPIRGSCPVSMSNCLVQES